MVKRMTVLLLAALLTAMLSGCGAAGVEQTNGQLHLYLAPYDNLWLGETIARYQELYPEVEVVIEDHSTEEYGAGVEAIRAELMAGRGPDLIFRPEYYFDDVEKTMTTGIFADLNPFLEADPDYRREDYYENVLKAGQNKGRQFVMPLDFDVPYLVTSKEALAEAGMDEEACKRDLLRLLKEAERYLQSGKKPYAFGTKGFGRQLPDFLGLNLLDYEKKTADFSAPGFREAVERYRSLYAQDLDSRRQYMNDDFQALFDNRDNRAVFSPFLYATAYNPLWSASVIGAEKTPVAFPVPDLEGKATAWVDYSAAIRSGSGNQQNAYNFIKLLLAPEWQSSMTIDRQFPVLRSQMDSRVQRLKAEAERGIVEGTYGGQNSFEDFSFQAVVLPETYYEELRTMVDKVGYVGFQNRILYDSVSQYMTPFYLGEKSFETCLAELQNAMTIYMTE